MYIFFTCRNLLLFFHACVTWTQRKPCIWKHVFIFLLYFYLKRNLKNTYEENLARIRRIKDAQSEWIFVYIMITRKSKVVTCLRLFRKENKVVTHLRLLTRKNKVTTRSCMFPCVFYRFRCLSHGIHLYGDDAKKQSGNSFSYVSLRIFKISILRSWPDSFLMWKRK